MITAKYEREHDVRKRASGWCVLDQDLDSIVSLQDTAVHCGVLLQILFLRPNQPGATPVAPGGYFIPWLWR